MHVIFLMIVALFTLVALLFVAALFSDEKVTIKREVVIDRPNKVVFDYVKLIRNQEHYNKWVMADPNMKKEYAGTDGVAGFVYKWESENRQTGKGEQEIKNVIEGERSDWEMRFIEPFKNVAAVTILTEAIDEDRTKVKFIFSGSRTYIMRVMYIVLNIKTMLSKDFDENLNNLKAVLER